ncbi:MAG: hypothetical protein SGPRY_002922 [Prymnesium sp.]
MPHRGASNMHGRGSLDLCSDSCPHALNGVCEDGAELQPSLRLRALQLWCDLGTDCTDCASHRMLEQFATLPQAMRGGSGNEPFVELPSPSKPSVAALRENGIEVRAARTATQPPFIFLFTNPAQDVDVSAAMAARRVVEPLYNLYWYQLSRSCCAAGGLVLDVGANFGYYSLYAAAMGCRVVAWEPVPAFRNFLRAAAQLNNLSHSIHIRPTVVSDVSGETVQMQVPEGGIWGTASVDGLNVDPSIRSRSYRVSVKTERLDDVVSEQACMMKLDVEGFEPRVIRGGARVFSRLPPRHILTEYTPGVMERKHDWAAMAEYPASLRTLLHAGYRIFNLQGTSKNQRVSRSIPWSKMALPALRQVSNASLAAEELNAINMRLPRSRLGFSIPWDLHPRSLHAEFAHNTDLLLTLDHSAVQASRDVGVWPDSPYGLGGGLCADVLRDGVASEMVGRLCVQEGRNKSIEDAVALAEMKRQIGPFLACEARKWRIEGPAHTRKRFLKRLTEEETTPTSQHRWRKWKNRGK